MSGIIILPCEKSLFLLINEDLMVLMRKTQLILRIPFFIYFLLIALIGRSQFYPRPDPVNPNLEVQLLSRLHRDTGADRIVTLAALANLYAFRPFKAPNDFQRANHYLQQAEEACTERYPQQLFNHLQLLKCNMLLAENQFDLAAQIAPRVDDTTRLMLCTAIASAWMNREDGKDAINNHTAKTWLGKAAALDDSVHNPILHNMVRQIFGELLIHEGKFVEAATCYNQVLASLTALHYPRLQFIHLNFCNLYLIRGEYNKALSNALQAIDYVLATRDSATAGDAYAELAFIFRNTGQLQKTIDNCNLAIGYYKLYPGRFGSLNWCISLYGQVFIGKKQYRQALEYFLQQYRLYPPQNPQESIRSTADIGDCYLKLKNYPEAERYFLREFNEKKIAGRLNEEAFHRLAFFYVESGNFKQALPWLDITLQHIEATTTAQTRGHLYYMRFLADSALGNYVSAINDLQANQHCDHIIEDSANQAEIQRLTVQYETEDKNKQINLLKKSNQLYRANQRNAVLVRNISIAAILVVGFVAFIFYRQYREIKKMAAMINEKNKQLSILLNEKEWLLKEVHHRVKNNLHTVISLLNIQAEFLKDDALKAIENSQHRIYAMSLIHQKLYAGESLTAINIAAYIGELIGYLKDSFGDNSDLRFQVEVESLDLDISIAIPLGLIINEAVSNSYKYAFLRKRKNNLIGVAVKKAGSEMLVDCWDNGTGLPMDALDARPGSLGLTLIKGLCKEINASLVLKNDNGAKIHIRIPIDNNVNSNLNW